MSSYLQQSIAENQLGQFEAALVHAEAAMRLQQDGAKPYLCAAFAAARLHGDERALHWVEQGLTVEPRNCLALATQANLLASLHRPQAALESSRLWLAIEPRNAEAHLSCARGYKQVQQYESAIASYARAAELAPRPAAALTDCSILLFELGRREEALPLLERALAADPTYAAAWYTRSEAKTFMRADPDIQIMRDLVGTLGAGAAALADKTLLHYALAKAHEDVDDCAQALHHLRAAGALKRASFNYGPAADERFMAEMARLFTAPAIGRLATAGAATPAPIFIVGMPRSGTSLLEQMLASHPQVFGGGESARMQGLIAALPGPYPACVSTLSRREVSALAGRYLALLPAHKSAFITDKTPYNFLHLGLIHVMFPEARIIHCKRDPVDTCASIYSTWFAQGNEFSYDLRELARYYRAYAQLMQHWRSLIPGRLLLEVEYEQLVQNFSAAARRVVDFCGLPWTDACLEFHQTARAVQTASKHQVRRPLYGSSVGRARRFKDLADELRRELALTPGAELGEDR
jgi:tetratricopeptide (TPR) repeat protein